MKDSGKKAIIIFVKNPVMGHVKTRLAEKVGQQVALRIYHYMLNKTRQLTLDFGNADGFVFYDNYIPCVDNWPEETFIKCLQAKGSLDKKLIHAFHTVSELDYESAIWLVTDCPRVSTAHIRKAFHELTTHDVVAGPTPGGGIYLIGINPVCSGVLNGLEWGRGTLLNQIQQTCKHHKLQAYLLPELQDVDTQEDLAELEPGFGHLTKGVSE